MQVEQYYSKVTIFCLCPLKHTANIRLNTNHVGMAAGKGEDTWSEDRDPEMSSVTAVRLEAR